MPASGQTGGWLRSDMEFLRCFIGVAALLIALAVPLGGALAGEPSANLALTEAERAWLRAHPVIRAQNESNWAPFNFNENGRPRGYSIDLMTLLAGKMGVGVDFVSGHTWGEYLDMMRTGGLDVMLNIVETPEREAFLEFTPSYVEDLDVMVTLKGRGISSIDQLDGKRVAIVPGFYTERIVRNSGRKVEFVPCADSLTCLRAVAYGKADVAIDNVGVVGYLIDHEGIYNLQVSGGISIADASMHLATRKGEVILRDILAKALAAVGDDERQDLKRRWFKSVANTLKPATVSLTDGEQAWLRDHPVIRVGNETDWAPYDFAEAGEPRGLSVDYLTLLAARLGLRIAFVTGPPWQGLLDMARRREVDVLLNAVDVPDRRPYLAFTRPYFRSLAVTVARKGGAVRGLADVTTGKVALVGGYYHERALRDTYPRIAPLVVDNSDKALKVVADGEAELALSDLGVAQHLIAHDPALFGLAITGGIGGEAFQADMRLAVRGDWPELLSILGKAMDTVGKDDFDAISRKWVGSADMSAGQGRVLLTDQEWDYLNRNAAIRYCADPDWMPFERIDDGARLVGIDADTIDLLSLRLGIPFRLVATRSKADSRERFRRGECDVLSLSPVDEGIADLAVATLPHLQLPLVIATRSDVLLGLDVAEFAGRRIAVVEGSPHRDWLVRTYPKVTVTTVRDVAEGLSQVRSGGVAALVEALPPVIHQIAAAGLSDVKISAGPAHPWALGMAVRRDAPELKGILDKAIAQISADERETIVRRWTSVRLEQHFDRRLLWQIGAAAGVALVLFVAWNRRLATFNRQLSRSRAELAVAHAELAARNQDLERLAVTDRLTGLNNRARLEDALVSEMERAQRYGSEFCVVLVDIDHFKAVNDTFGHVVGDTVLTEVATIQKNAMRHCDVLGRWGGEEFLIICPETGLDQANAVAEKVRDLVAAFPFPGIGQVTASFGVAQYRASDSGTSLTARADAALYRAKNGGRNRVETAEE